MRDAPVPAKAVRAAIEELEAIALLLRTADLAGRPGGLTIVGPGVARVIEGTASRLMDALPQLPTSPR